MDHDSQISRSQFYFMREKSSTVQTAILSGRSSLQSPITSSEPFRLFIERKIPFVESLFLELVPEDGENSQMLRIHFLNLLRGIKPLERAQCFK